MTRGEMMTGRKMTMMRGMVTMRGDDNKHEWMMTRVNNEPNNNGANSDKPDDELGNCCSDNDRKEAVERKKRAA